MQQTVSTRLGIQELFTTSPTLPVKAENLLKAASDNSLNRYEAYASDVLKIDPKIFNPLGVKCFQNEKGEGCYYFPSIILPGLLSFCPQARQHVNLYNVELISWEAGAINGVSSLDIVYHIEAGKGFVSELKTLKVAPCYAAELAEIRNERYSQILEDSYESLETWNTLDEVSVQDILTECLIDYFTFRSSLILID